MWRCGINYAKLDANHQTTTTTSTEEGYKLQLYLSLEGANHNLNLYQRGSTTNKGLQLGGIFQRQTIPFFSQTNDPNIIG